MSKIQRIEHIKRAGQPGEDRIFTPSDTATCARCGRVISKYREAFGRIGGDYYCVHNGCYHAVKSECDD